MTGPIAQAGARLTASAERLVALAGRAKAIADEADAELVRVHEVFAGIEPAGVVYVGKIQRVKHHATEAAFTALGVATDLRGVASRFAKPPQ